MVNLRMGKVRILLIIYPLSKIILLSQGWGYFEKKMKRRKMETLLEGIKSTEIHLVSLTVTEMIMTIML